MASRSVNKALIVGRLGKDSETKFTSGGTAKTTFSVATEYRYKDRQSNEWKSTATWHNVVLWKSEKLAEYLTKGKMVYVEGRIDNRSYEDQSGNRKYISEIIADDVILLGGERSERKPANDWNEKDGQSSPATPSSSGFDAGEDEPPF